MTQHRKRARRPRPTGGPGAGPNFKSLYRKLADALAEIHRTEDITRFLEQSLESLVARFRDELGFEGGRIYRREGDDFFLCCGFGTSRCAPLGLRVPRDYPPHRLTLEQGVVLMGPGQPGYDEEFERTIGVSSTFAAITVGQRDSHVIAFSIVGEVREDRVLTTLTAVRHAINLKLEQQRLTGILEESRTIQESMLPWTPPVFDGFQIDGRSRPAERVSGDLFDYLSLSPRLLGIALADASGHGVPAALMARDVITGLRMSAGEGGQVAEVVERLNRVVHRAALASKFVSLFYLRLAWDGTLVYCNAGHNPPLLNRSDGFVGLEAGGPVLGPIPTARYREGREGMEPGDTLVLFTDGVVERTDARGREFGVPRLRSLLAECGGSVAGEIADAVFRAVDQHAGAERQEDDMTVVVVRRT